MLKIVVVGSIATIETDAKLSAIKYASVVEEAQRHPTEEQSTRDDEMFMKGYDKAKAEQADIIAAKDLLNKELVEELLRRGPKPEPEPAVKTFEPIVLTDAGMKEASDNYANDRYVREKIIYETRRSECMRAIWKAPDHNGYLPPGLWKMSKVDFDRLLTRQSLIEHLNGWILRIATNGDENLAYTYYVKIPENMPATGNLTDYLKSLPQID